MGVVESTAGGMGASIAFVSGDLVASGISGGDLVCTAANARGGGGRKDPALSQAGGPAGDRIDDALSEAKDAAHEALAGR